MKTNKPFWETKNNPITGYRVESMKDVVDNHILDRVYSDKGFRYAESASRAKRRLKRGLEEFVILNNEEI